MGAADGCWAESGQTFGVRCLYSHQMGRIVGKCVNGGGGGEERERVLEWMARGGQTASSAVFRAGGRDGRTPRRNPEKPGGGGNGVSPKTMRWEEVYTVQGIALLIPVSGLTDKTASSSHPFIHKCGRLVDWPLEAPGRAGDWLKLTLTNLSDQGCCPSFSLRYADKFRGRRISFYHVPVSGAEENTDGGHAGKP